MESLDNQRFGNDSAADVDKGLGDNTIENIMEVQAAIPPKETEDGNRNTIRRISLYRKRSEAVDGVRRILAVRRRAENS